MLRIVAVQNSGYNLQIGKLVTKREHFFPVNFQNDRDISKIENSG